MGTATKGNGQDEIQALVLSGVAGEEQAERPRTRASHKRSGRKIHMAEDMFLTLDTGACAEIRPGR